MTMGGAILEPSVGLLKLRARENLGAAVNHDLQLITGNKAHLLADPGRDRLPQNARVAPGGPVAPGYGSASTMTRATLVFVETQNVTLSLPKNLLRKVKLIAVGRETSISRLLVQALEDLASRDKEYEKAKRRDLRRLAKPANLGTGGRASWTRDDLHERG